MALSLFLSEYKLNPPECFFAKIREFCELLLEANKSTNLVSKNDEQKLMTRHIADSLIFAAYLTEQQKANGSQWADIGSGAGFPVIPLCIYFPQVKFYAIECRKKRCEFLNSVKQKLNLQNLEIIQGRTLPHPPVDFVSCRAVSSLENDFALAQKIMKKDGIFLTVKSKRIIDEMKAKKSKLLERAKIWNYRLPQEEMEYVHVQI